MAKTRIGLSLLRSDSVATCIACAPLLGTRRASYAVECPRNMARPRGKKIVLYLCTDHYPQILNILTQSADVTMTAERIVAPRICAERSTYCTSNVMTIPRMATCANNERVYS